MSTISDNGWPHVVPISYIYVGRRFYAPSNKNTKKVRNLMKNDKATIGVDDDRSEDGIMLECTSRIIEGKRAKPLRDYMRRVKHWKNDQDTVIIQLIPVRKTSWFKD